MLDIYYFGIYHLKYLLIISSFFLKPEGLNQLVKTVKLLLFSIYSVNKIQKYPHIIELLSCILNILLLMFLISILSIIISFNPFFHKYNNPMCTCISTMI